MPAKNDDLHGSAPDKSKFALLVIDVINDLDFPEANQLLRFARPMARKLLRLKERAKKAGVPVIYVNDNFGRWQSDFRRQVQHCLRGGSHGHEIVALLQPEEDDYFVLKPNFCVLFTANDAYMRDYGLIIPSDCTASNTAAENKEALSLMRKFLKADTRPSTGIRLPVARQKKHRHRLYSSLPVSVTMLRHASHSKAATGTQRLVWTFSRLRGKLSRGIRPSLTRQTRRPRRPKFSHMPTVSSSFPDPVLETHVFWDRHKKEVIAALVIALLALVGYGGYRLYADRHNNAAAALLASAKTEGDYQKVITQYSGTPASASAYIFLASEQRKGKKYSEANATLQSFIAKNPKHELAGTARMAMAANLESLGKRDEALTMYQRLAADNPQGFTAPIALISTVPLFKEKNQIEEARRVCETILTQYRDSAISMEATQQLRLLKGGSESKSPTPPSAPTAGTPAPAVSAVVASPVPGAVRSAAPPAAVAPPAPSITKPATSPPKKP